LRVLRAANTLFRRRGVGYVGYLARGVAWPKAAYRFGWGPRAPRLIRPAFDAALLFATVPAVRADRADVDALLTDVPADTDGQVSAASVEALMDRAHRAGITGLRHAFGQIVRTPDGARLPSLSGLRLHRRRGVLFDGERDADRVAFNSRFRSSVLTEASVRAQLADRKARVPPGYRDYAPIDFSRGVTIGQFMATDSGTGRWEFFNGPIVAPLVKGKRVVDLGSNNGSMPLMMLRAGARSVVGFEFTPQIADFARLNAEILAWRDLRPYDVRIVTGDMRLFLSDDTGPFDVVTAFCSLYYLPIDDMARVVRKAAAHGATLILQANDAIDNLPAHAADLQRLMLDNGYADVDLHRAPGFVRPLLVGRPAVGAARAPGTSKAALVGA